MFIEIIILNLLVNPLVISGDNVLNGNDERASVAQYLIRKVLSEINPNENAVIAPNEIQNLFNELRSASASDSPSASDSALSSSHTNSNPATATATDNEINTVGVVPPSGIQHTAAIVAAPAIYQPMQVTNKLQIVEFQNQQNTKSNNNNNHRRIHNTTNKIVGKLENLKELADWFATKHAGTASMQLINDVTLSARWAFNFQKRDTHKRLFYPPHQDQHTYLDAMRKDDIFQYGRLKDLNATALVLSLHPQDYKLILLLPHALNGLLPMAKHLSENFHLIADENAFSQQLRTRLVRVILPKLRITHTIKLNDVFRELNLTSVWPEHATIKQHTHLNINERGIGNLERTTVLFWNAFSSFRTSPAIFELNHPFLFFIRNSQGIQFFGYINKNNS